MSGEGGGVGTHGLVERGGNTGRGGNTVFSVEPSFGPTPFKCPFPLYPLLFNLRLLAVPFQFLISP